MRNLKKYLLGLLLLGTLSASVAMAGDDSNFCISGFPNPVWVLVGQHFKVPKAGKCILWRGFNPATGANNPASGIGCTSSDGSNLTVTVTTSDPGFVESDTVSLALPGLTGSYGGQYIAGDGVQSLGPFSGITAAACATNTIPAAHAPRAAMQSSAGPVSR